MDIDSLLLVNPILEAKHEACLYMYDGKNFLIVHITNPQSDILLLMLWCS